MIRVKQWDSLTVPQKRNVIELAAVMKLPLADLNRACFHTRGDWVTSIGFIWRKLYVARVIDGNQCEFVVMVAALSMEEADQILRKVYGKCFCSSPPVKELCIVAGESESKVIGEERI